MLIYRGVLIIMKQTIAPLSENAAERLLKDGFGADSGNKKTKSISAILAGRICTIFNLVNAIIAIALVAVGSYKNLAFLGVVIFNTCVGIFQEVRAKLITDKLLKAKMPTVTVIRAEGQKVIGWNMAVKGDTIILKEGSAVKADCRLIDGYCEYDDSALTGETETVSASCGDIIPSGAAIVAGNAVCVISAVGAETREYAIRESARRHKLKASVMTDTLNGIIKSISFALIPLGALFFSKLFFIDGHDITHSVNSVAAAIVGMIPSGLILLTSTALAVSVIRLSTKHMLINEMNSIEMLARTNVLCVDKTGTLTTGRLIVDEIKLYSDRDECEKALKTAASQCGNATASAISEHIGAEALEVIASIPFSSKRKFSAVKTSGGVYILGAPDVLLDREMLVKHDIDSLCASHRVVCLCRCDDIKDGEPLGDMHLMCLILLREELRDGARDTVYQLQSQGVCIKVISGDNPITVRASAMRCGIINAERIFDLSTAAENTDYAEIAKSYTVFGRSTPEQKMKLIAALKASGNIVAMTGDGINDLPAMKEASCSIALSNAADGAKCASDITLSTNGFFDIPAIIDEGRTVINNISNYAALFLTKTVLSFALTLAFIFVPWRYSLQPIQLTLTGTLLIGLPAFLLSLLHNKSRPDGKLKERIMFISLPAGIYAAAACLCLASLGADGGAWAYSIAIAFACVLVMVCLPFNHRKLAIVLTSVALLVLLMVFARGFFEISVSAQSIAETVIAALSTATATFTTAFICATKSQAKQQTGKK